MPGQAGVCVDKGFRVLSIKMKACLTRVKHLTHTERVGYTQNESVTHRTSRLHTEVRVALGRGATLPPYDELPYAVIAPDASSAAIPLQNVACQTCLYHHATLVCV